MPFSTTILAASSPCNFFFSDFQYVQAVLANGADFAATTICNVFEMIRHGVSWKRGLDDDTIFKYLKAKLRQRHNIELSWWGKGCFRQ